MAKLRWIRGKRFVRSIQGGIVSIGAPLGLYIISRFESTFSPSCAGFAIYSYMAVGTFLAFTIFGFLIGKREDQCLMLSLTDSLTGIFNARYLHLRLAKEVAAARRNQTEISLIILDLDHFKRINDKFGHPAGDLVLATIGQAVQKIVRKGDTLARVGGEEFALVLPGTSCDQAVELAERIRRTLRTLEIQLTPKESVTVSASLGVSCSTHYPDLEPEALYSKADQALLQAKEEGRDCIRVAREGATLPPTESHKEKPAP